MYTIITDVTPEMAGNFLAKNADFQRSVRWTTVKVLEEAMKRGEWKLTHQGIAFDSNGKLVDGQHRLLAIQRSGVTVKMSVTYDIEPTCFRVMDIGARRTTSDLLNIGKREASITTMLARLAFKSPSSTQSLVIYDALEKEIGETLSVASQCRNVFSGAAAQAACVISIVKRPEDKDYILDLYHNLNTLTLDKLPPIGNAIVRQCFNGKTGNSDAQRRDLFGRCMFVFDYSKRDAQRVQLSESSLSLILEDTRTLVRSFFQ